MIVAAHVGSVYEKKYLCWGVPVKGNFSVPCWVRGLKEITCIARKKKLVLGVCEKKTATHDGAVVKG